MSTQPFKNGCHNRAEFAAAQTIGKEHVMVMGHLVTRPVQIPNFSVADSSCKYTLSGLGQADAGCAGCLWRASL